MVILECRDATFGRIGRFYPIASQPSLNLFGIVGINRTEQGPCSVLAGDPASIHNGTMLLSYSGCGRRGRELAAAAGAFPMVGLNV